ncbi:hypothetical protein [Streptomyces sp. Ru72]|uniref:hypothetical protein n=1 Tax=Streptomyces sp. Ru72 TaxID=2080747 RepID=UPI000CDD244D|nr:hypothetical protein [Streptomyces sp. Ru72]POX44813.1 hypothetical protein C3488_31615 [Streptomyces sp. Ru72]
MRKGQRSRLDDRTAERLLRRVPGAGGEEFGSLSAVLRAAAATPEDVASADGEEAAVAAFRAVSAGALPAASAGAPRYRRRRTPGWAKAGIGAVTAALTFGGVAVAVQTDALHLPLPGGSGRTPGGAQVSASSHPRPSTTPAPGELPDADATGAAPASGKPAARSSSDAADPSAAAQSLRSLCTAYRGARQTHGHPPTAPRRLVEAAGSEAAVADYCAHLPAPDGGRDGGGGDAGGSGAAGKTPSASAGSGKKGQ